MHVWESIGVQIYPNIYGNIVLVLEVIEEYFQLREHYFYFAFRFQWNLNQNFYLLYGFAFQPYKKRLHCILQWICSISH